MLLKREKALPGLGGKEDFKAQGKIVRLDAVMPNLNAMFSRGRLIWLTGSVLVMREGCVLDIGGF